MLQDISPVFEVISVVPEEEEVPVGCFRVLTEVSLDLQNISESKVQRFLLKVFCGC